MNKIHLNYLLIGQKKFTNFDINLEEYFDIEQDEIVAIDSVPKYFQPYEYIGISTEKLLIVNLYLEIDGNSLELKQSFWNEGQNFLTERITCGLENYRELIISSCISKDERVDETLRLFFGETNIYPIHHGFIKRNSENIEEENLLDLINFSKFR